MPTCPGCHRSINHDELPVHLQICDEVRGTEQVPSAVLEPLERRIIDVEDRIENHENDLMERLTRLEKSVQSHRTTGPE